MSNWDILIETLKFSGSPIWFLYKNTNIYATKHTLLMHLKHNIYVRMYVYPYIIIVCIFFKTWCRTSYMSVYII